MDLRERLRCEARCDAERAGLGGPPRAERAGGGGDPAVTRGAQLVDRGGGAKRPAMYGYVRCGARRFFRVSGENNPWISEGVLFIDI